jgi:hypothetical protein
LELNEQYIVNSGVPMVQVIPFKRESWKMETKVDYEDKQRTNSIETNDLRLPMKQLQLGLRIGINLSLGIKRVLSSIHLWQN